MVWGLGSALDHIDLHRLDADPQFLKPFDGGVDFRELAIQLQADNSDFIGHARLAISGSWIRRGGYISHKRLCSGCSRRTVLAGLFFAERFI